MSIFIFLIPCIGGSHRVLGTLNESTKPTCIEWVNIRMIHLWVNISGLEVAELEKTTTHLSFNIIQGVMDVVSSHLCGFRPRLLLVFVHSFIQSITFLSEKLSMLLPQGVVNQTALVW